MSTVWIVPIEPISTRYTSEWFEHFPRLVARLAHQLGRTDVVVRQIEVPYTESPSGLGGAFLDFTATQAYKSLQLQELVRYAQGGEVKSGDSFVFTDAWNPNVLALRYVLELSGLNCTLHGLWHAGAYDPYDFLARAPNARGWLTKTELAIHDALDCNFFATEFSRDLFYSKHQSAKSTSVVAGWPMNYLAEDPDYLLRHRTDIKQPFPAFVFPHRIAPEKNLEVAQAVVERVREVFPSASLDVCQESKLSKTDYHKQLAAAHYCLSFSRQETLGIGTYEAMLLGVVPFVPDALSYREMYPDEYRYQSDACDVDAVATELIAKLSKYTYSVSDKAHSDAVLDVAKFFDGTCLCAVILQSTR